jgi:hypothetical protein
MKTILLTILISSITQIAILLIVRGFEKSYWGSNSIQEITRFFNRYCKHYQKDKKNEI